MSLPAVSLLALRRHSVSCQRRPRRRPGDRSQTKGAVLPEGATLPRLSDTGSKSAAAAAAALLLAGFRRLASTRRIELRRGVLAVALRASRANEGTRRRRRDARTTVTAGLSTTGADQRRGSAVCPPRVLLTLHRESSARAFRPGPRARERRDQARAAGADRWRGQGRVGAHTRVSGPRRDDWFRGAPPGRRAADWPRSARCSVPTVP